MKAQRKILYIIPFLARGGTEKQLLALVELLDKDRFSPYIMSLYGVPDEIKKKISVPIIDLNVNSMFSLSGFKKIAFVVSFARKNKIDIVQTFFIDPTIIGFFVKLFGGVSKFYSARRDLGFWYTSFKLWVLRFINFFTDKIIVNSNAIKDNVVKVEKLSPDKIAVIHNGVDIFDIEYIKKFYDEKRNELGIRGATKVIGITGNFNRYIKRYDLFIDMANLVLRKRKDIVFLILGFGDLRSELDRQINRYGINDYIKFLGSKDNPLPYMATFDVAINCSDSEGFSNSVLEYMALEKAIVVTDNKGNTELIQNNVNGLVTPCSDATKLADAVLKLLDDDRLMCDLAREARKTVEKKYSMQKMINDTIKYYI